MRKLFDLIALALVSVALSIQAGAASTTVINTIQDFQNIQNDLSGNYVLGGNIDASGFAFTPISSEFTGTLDGNGFSISNLTIDSAVAFGAVAPFDSIGFGGSVENLNLVNISYNGSATSIGGGLAASNLGSISNVRVSGAINAGSVGGLVFGNDAVGVGGQIFAGTIDHSGASVAIVYNTVGTDGGLAGRNQGTITDSFATGSIFGGLVQSCSGGCGLSTTGGFVGQNNGTIDRSFATGNVASVAGSNSVLGGFVGSNSSIAFFLGYSATIQTSFATGSVIATGDVSQAGGFVGQIDFGSSISQAYAMGDAFAASQGSGVSVSRAGGFAGASGGSISEAFSTGEVSATATGTGLVLAFQGGAVGQTLTTSSMNNLYWDTNTSGTFVAVGSGISDGATGLSTAILQSGALPQGFSPIVWTATSGQYPALNLLHSSAISLSAKQSYAANAGVIDKANLGYSLVSLAAGCIGNVACTIIGTASLVSEELGTKIPSSVGDSLTAAGLLLSCGSALAGAIGGPLDAGLVLWCGLDAASFLAARVSDIFSSLASDPPDPNYNQVISPSIETPPISLTGACTDLATAGARVPYAISDALGWLNAMNTTANRYGSALAANDFASAELQLGALGQFSVSYDAAAQTANTDLKCLANLLNLNGINQSITSQDESVLLALIQSDPAVESFLDNYFEPVGFSDAEIQVAMQSILDTPPNLPFETPSDGLVSLADALSPNGEPSNVPEPFTVLLFASGLVVIVALRRTNKAKTDSLAA